MARKYNKSSEHYVDNVKFFEVMSDYRKSLEDAVGSDLPFKQAYEEAVKSGVQLPRIPEYVGECLQRIAVRLSYSSNFINYTWRDEMIADGVENCIRYIHNFDPSVSNNPFSYFTRIIWFAFLRRIAAEKKQRYIRYKSMERAMLLDDLVSRQPGDESGYLGTTALEMEGISNFITDYEKSLAEQKKKK